MDNFQALTYIHQLMPEIFVNSLRKQLKWLLPQHIVVKILDN